MFVCFLHCCDCSILFRRIFCFGCRFLADVIGLGHRFLSFMLGRLGTLADLVAHFLGALLHLIGHGLHGQRRGQREEEQSRTSAGSGERGEARQRDTADKDRKEKEKEMSHHTNSSNVCVRERVLCGCSRCPSYFPVSSACVLRLCVVIPVCAFVCVLTTGCSYVGAGLNA